MSPHLQLYFTVVTLYIFSMIELHNSRREQDPVLEFLPEFLLLLKAINHRFYNNLIA